MKARYHVGVSLLISWWLAAALKSWELATSSLIAGIFVDLDHVVDYWIAHGPRFDVDHFFHTHDNEEYELIYLVLHGWELLSAGLILAWLFNGNHWVLGACLGLGIHLALDQIFNRPSPWGYAIIWRWRHGFRYRRSFPYNGR